MPSCTHYALRVHDIERSIRFYETILPGKMIARRDSSDRWRTSVAWIEPDGQPGFAVVLICAKRVRWLLKLFHAVTPRVMRSFEHPGFACATREEVDGRAELARRLGAKILHGPTQGDGKSGYLLEVLDPDNNPVEWTFDQVFG